jgi:hypothetical protein
MNRVLAALREGDLHKVTVENYLTGVNVSLSQKILARTITKAIPRHGKRVVNLIGQASVAFF